MGLKQMFVRPEDNLTFEQKPEATTRSRSNSITQAFRPRGFRSKSFVGGWSRDTKRNSMDVPSSSRTSMDLPRKLSISSDWSEKAKLPGRIFKNLGSKSNSNDIIDEYLNPDPLDYSVNYVSHQSRIKPLDLQPVTNLTDDIQPVKPLNFQRKGSGSKPETGRNAKRFSVVGDFRKLSIYEDMKKIGGDIKSFTTNKDNKHYTYNNGNPDNGKSYNGNSNKGHQDSNSEASHYGHSDMSFSIPYSAPITNIPPIPLPDNFQLPKPITQSTPKKATSTSETVLSVPTSPKSHNSMVSTSVTDTSTPNSSISNVNELDALRFRIRTLESLLSRKDDQIDRLRRQLSVENTFDSLTLQSTRTAESSFSERDMDESKFTIIN